MPRVYLVRTSQFIVGVNKYLEAVKNGFTVGMRFRMKFEGEDVPEKWLALFFQPNDISLMDFFSLLSNCFQNQVGRNCWFSKNHLYHLAALPGL